MMEEIALKEVDGDDHIAMDNNDLGGWMSKKTFVG